MANAGEIVTERCLVLDRKLGFEYPGSRGNVQAKIVRTDAPWNKGNFSRIRNVARVWGGRSLFEATGVRRITHGVNVDDVAE